MLTIYYDGQIIATGGPGVRLTSQHLSSEDDAAIERAVDRGFEVEFQGRIWGDSPKRAHAHWTE